MTMARLALRRSAGLLAAPLLVGLVFSVLFSREGWSWEWNRALSWSAGSSILIGPVLAGLGAFEAWRGTRGAVAQIASTTRRGPMAIYAGTLAVWLYGVVAWALGLIVAILVASRNDPGGNPDLWVVAQGVGALLASASIGGAIGAHWKHLAAAPVAALGVYLSPLLLMPLGLRDLLIAGGATGTMAGIETVPMTAISQVAAQVAIAAVCAVLVLSRYRPRFRRTNVAIVATSVVAAVTVGLYAGLVPMENGYRFSNSPDECTSSSDDSVIVCGPPEAAAVHRVAAESLAEASALTSARGVRGSSIYEDGGSGRKVAPSYGILTVTTEEIVDGRLSRSDIVSALVVPRACPELYGEAAPTALLTAQASLAEWINSVLDGDPTLVEEDSKAQQTMNALFACDVTATAPEQGQDG